MYICNLIFNAEFLSMALRESDAASFHFKAEKAWHIVCSLLAKQPNISSPNKCSWKWKCSLQSINKKTSYADDKNRQVVRLKVNSPE